MYVHISLHYFNYVSHLLCKLYSYKFCKLYRIPNYSSGSYFTYIDHYLLMQDRLQQCVAILFTVDLCKAFDSLDHCVLLQWICNLGAAAGRQVILWFKNCLPSRACTSGKAGDRYSDWGSMSVGIPQRSALSLLQFDIIMLTPCHHKLLMVFYYNTLMQCLK